MKKLGIFLMGCVVAMPSVAAVNLFNHKGIQKGAVSENCYRNPCSIIKVMDFKLLENRPNYRLIQLKVVGGRRGWEAKNINWNHNTHNLYITCSLTSPTVQNGDQITTLPINSDYVLPGVLYGDGILYSQACHNSDADMDKLAIKYGYNIADDGNW